ncbi:MAG TPA: rhomboid family intramembrane serine protease [Bacteroidales bacterium]|nr:rhomboid family intramembrane serine protease [Bacteroidales bacterium]
MDPTIINDKILFRFSIFMAFLLCLPMVVTFVFEDFFSFLTGIYPLTGKGLFGVLTAPFIHADWSHLAGNISALFILYLVLFNNFHPMAWVVILLSYIVPGFWTWLFARAAWHVGASMMVYSLASFVFFAGIFSGHTRLMALSLFVVFMYGGIFWGIFPTLPEISWEGHLSGFLLGILLAFFYRKDIRNLYPKKEYFEDEEPGGEDDNEKPNENGEQ